MSNVSTSGQTRQVSRASVAAIREARERMRKVYPNKFRIRREDLPQDSARAIFGFIEALSTNIRSFRLEGSRRGTAQRGREIFCHFCSHRSTPQYPSFSSHAFCRSYIFQTSTSTSFIGCRTMYLESGLMTARPPKLQTLS